MNRALKIISAVVWALCAAGTIYCYVYTVTVIEECSAADIWLFILFFVLSLVTASGIHELGHFVFGLLSGMYARLTVKSVLPSLRSTCVEIIPKKEDKIKSRLIITALGGIVFNLLFIALGAVALFVPQVPVLISSVAIFHLSLFLDNALPIAYNSGKSDGLVIFELLRNTPESRVMIAVLKVQSHVLAGKPVGEYDKDCLFDLPQIAEDDPSFISLCELRAKYFEAVGDDLSAAEYRERFEQLKKEYID